MVSKSGISTAPALAAPLPAPLSDLGAGAGARIFSSIRGGVFGMDARMSSTGGGCGLPEGAPLADAVGESTPAGSPGRGSISTSFILLRTSLRPMSSSEKGFDRENGARRQAYGRHRKESRTSPHLSFPQPQIAF